MASTVRVRRALSRGRRAAESRMGATNGGSDVTVWRDLGLGEQDPDTGIQPRIWATVYIDKPCRLAASGWGASPTRTLSVPGGDTSVALRTCSFPASFDLLEDGDLIEVLEGDCAGQVLQIVDASQADQRTAMRVPVIGAHRPEEWDEEES